MATLSDLDREPTSVDWSIHYKVESSFGGNRDIRLEGPCGGRAECTLQTTAITGYYVVPTDGEEERCTTKVIPTDLGLEVYRAFRNAPIDPMTTALMGLDGSSHTLTISAEFDSVTFEWWEDLPVEWQGLAPALAMLLHLSGSEGS